MAIPSGSSLREASSEVTTSGLSAGAIVAVGSAVGVAVGSGADMTPQAAANRDNITINGKYRMVRFMFFLLFCS
jgi:hypothetical protein